MSWRQGFRSQFVVGKLVSMSMHVLIRNERFVTKHRYFLDQLYVFFSVTYVPGRI